MSKLIEKEGKFYKKCGVVMLETKGCTNIHKDKRANSYPKLQKPSFLGGIWKNDPNHYQNVQATRDGLQENFHLYITSYDEIKEGDWYLEPNVDIKPTQCKKISELTKDDKKIIATTNPLLDPCCDDGLPKVCNCNLGLPQPSDKFIQAFIDAYNKGEKIDKVLVEYVIHPNSFVPLRIPKLKDNNIIIKRAKDIWSRDEVCNLLNEYRVYTWKNGSTAHDLSKWIEENL